MALFGFKIIPTSKISDNVFAIKSQMVNFFLYVDRDNIIAVDVGTKNKATLLELKSINIDLIQSKLFFLLTVIMTMLAALVFSPMQNYI
jgi:hypothetical protein